MWGVRWRWACNGLVVAVVAGDVVQWTYVDAGMLMVLSSAWDAEWTGVLLELWWAPVLVCISVKRGGPIGICRCLICDVLGVV